MRVRRAAEEGAQLGPESLARMHRARLPFARAASGLLSLLALGLAGAAGCAGEPTTESADESERSSELVDEARQPASTPTVCVDLKRSATLAAHDANISNEKPNNNFGASAFALSGASSGGLAGQFYALFRFSTATIPANATVVSATVTLSQTNNGASTANAHLITAPWNEATVTWSSFGGAFENQAFKSFSTASATITFNVAPQVQAWLDGSSPNHGFLIEQAGPFQTKYKSQEYAIASQRPVLRVCYNVVCGPGFADCNGVAADGCETDLGSIQSCGACGVVCSFPHASAACDAGSCALGACDQGFGDCDGDPANGCEVDLATSDESCGACGKVCSAGGHCTNGSCGGGDILVGGEASNAVHGYDRSTGAFTGVFASGGLSGPDGLAFGPDGNLYVSSYASSQIHKFNGTTGAAMGLFIGAGSGGLSTPVGITFGADGNLYVGNRGTASILRFNGSTGAFLGTFASGGGLSGPDCLTFGPNGDLYVSSRFSNQVIVYHGATGAFKTVLVNGGGLSTPEGLAFDAMGNLLVVSRGNNTVRRYHPTTGAFLGTWASGAGLNVPFGIIRASDGDVYVANAGDSSVLKFDGATGASLGVFVAPGSGGLSLPTAIIQHP
jgi:sugar lactone lactonase YvrE